jgi:hypothetical protein
MVLLAGCDERIQEMRPSGELPNHYWPKRGNFHPFSLKHCISIHIYIKSEDVLKMFSKLLLPLYFLSHHKASSPGQTAATVVAGLL